MSEIEEVAKTVSNALDKSEKFGGFITKYFGTTMEQSIGIFNDKLIYWRWENQQNLITKANQKMKKLGIDITTKQIPLKLGLPLIEAASLEDDNELQEIWANLLVNSSINFSLERSYINVLEQLSSLEVKILIKIYSNIKYERNIVYRVDATQLPKSIKITKHIENTEKVLIDTIEKKSNTIEESNTHLALLNLSRLQCIEGTISTFGGITFYNTVIPTLFGAKLYEAVKEPNK